MTLANFGNIHIIGLQLSNSFESLDEVEEELPPIPDIPNVENLNETQRKMLLLQMAEKLNLSPDSLSDASEMPQNSLPMATSHETDEAGLANVGQAASAAPQRNADGTFARPGQTPSRK